MGESKPDVERYELYAREVTIAFNPASHRYTVSDRGGKPTHCPSVTTILNVLAKPALVEWGVRVACDYMEAGLHEIFASDSLSLEEILKLVGDARQAHNRIKTEAGEIGTSAHDWLAQYWRAKLDLAPAPQPLEEGPVQNCITGAMAWIKKHEVVPMFIEQPRYSRKHKITGTSDFIGLVDGKMSTVDYKSSKSLYPEIALQMAAYAGMYEEEYNVPVRHRVGLRMDKTNGTFEDRTYPAETFEEDSDTFLAAFKLYDRLKYLRRKPKLDWIDALNA